MNGAGSSNNGNTSRRAFQNPEILAELLELDEKLIKNLHSILVCLLCQLPINPIKFRAFCLETAEIFVSNYEWYNMPATVHAILVHGAEIMINMPLPAGMYGEEGLEACNKFIKSNRTFHSRRDSRLHTMTDMFHRRMDASDPLISTIRTAKSKKIHKDKLPEDVIKLLSSSDNITFTNDESMINQQIESFNHELDCLELNNNLLDD